MDTSQLFSKTASIMALNEHNVAG